MGCFPLLIPHSCWYAGRCGWKVWLELPERRQNACLAAQWHLSQENDSGVIGTNKPGCQLTHKLNKNQLWAKHNGRTASYCWPCNYHFRPYLLLELSPELPDSCQCPGSTEQSQILDLPSQIRLLDSAFQTTIWTLIGLSLCTTVLNELHCLDLWLFQHALHVSVLH